MYLVENNLIDLIISRTPKEFIKRFAQLAPSMKVVPITEVNHTFRYLNTNKLQEYIDISNIEVQDTDYTVVEDYVYDYNSNATVTLDDNIISIYHPYRKRT